VLDAKFIEQHTAGLEKFEEKARSTPWEEIEAESGLSRESIEGAADVFIKAERVASFYGMGLTQHVHGFDNVAMLLNLHLLRGMIGRDGTGVSPVRGHSNVQGQRTVGIATKPADAPLDKLAKQFGFEPPRDEGLDTVQTCTGVLKGEVKAFIGLGGNFLRAMPERALVESKWPQLRLTVQVATKLNHSHVVNGQVAYLLPCLGRTEEDMQTAGAQAVSMEDTFSTIYGSLGRRKPASEHLRSEIAIVAGIAKATLPDNPKVKWDAWTGDYALIRDAIAETYPEFFRDFNAKLWKPGGFYRGNKARERIWETKSGKAQFTTPETLTSVSFSDAPGRYRLITLRSNDQFNTTIYGFSDRLRGIEGTRQVLLMNPDEISRAGLKAGQMVSLVTDADDGVSREAGPLKVTPYKLPDGCVVSYYPEMNWLVPLGHHDLHSRTPAYKSIPVRIKA
jgi:molybdopterin-dependent oxidoreductase alpha subunit